MTSKLLQAIVGVGIAFGAGTGCGGSSTSVDDAPNDGPDASKFDPFCDSTWPTTKGNPGPPLCTDPQMACDPLTRLSCVKPIDGLRCEHERHSGFCIDGEWQCHPDQVDYTTCRCFGEPPPDMVCTETGWMSTGPGS